MNRIKYFFNQVLILLAAVTTQATLAESEPEANPDKTCHISVGWGDWPPYQYLDQNNQVTGLQIELLDKIAERANCQLSYKLQSFEENQRGVAQGSIDMTPDITITEQRKTFAYFSAPYRQEILALYLRSDLHERCETSTIKEMLNDGLRIGLTRGNIYGEEISRLQKIPEFNKKFTYNNKNNLHLELVEKGLLDGFFEDPTVMAYNLKLIEKTGWLKACQVTVSSGSVSLMFSKKSVPLDIVQRFDRALEKIKLTDYYRSIWGW